MKKARGVPVSAEPRTPTTCIATIDARTQVFGVLLQATDAAIAKSDAGRQWLNEVDLLHAQRESDDPEPWPTQGSRRPSL